MRISRRALLQAGAGLETAIRRDLSNAITVGLDAAIFQGSGADGQPLGLVPGAATYGFHVEAVDAPATWAAVRAEIAAFLAVNAASTPGATRILFRPEIWDAMDAAIFDPGSAVTEWGRLVANVPAGNIALSSNALPAPVGDPPATTAVRAPGRAFVSAAAEHGPQFLLEDRLDETAHPLAYPVFERVKGTIADQ